MLPADVGHPVGVGDVEGHRGQARLGDRGWVPGGPVDRSSGLTGLVDRVEALGGRFSLDSPPGRGTTISIQLPLDAQTIDEP